MIKRVISEYSSFILIFLELFLLFTNHKLGFIFVYIIWYCLYGMVGLAFLCSTKGKVKLSDFFLKVSIPITLLPFRKAFYYWTKSVNVILLDSTRVPEAIKIAKKVNTDNLYTDNNRSFFFCFLAALYNDLGCKEEAWEYFDMSRKLPHKKFVDESLEKLERELAEKK